MSKLPPRNCLSAADAFLGLVDIQRKTAGREDLAHDAAHRRWNRRRSERASGSSRAHAASRPGLRASSALVGLASSAVDCPRAARAPRGAEQNDKRRRLERHARRGAPLPCSSPVSVESITQMSTPPLRQRLAARAGIGRSNSIGTEASAAPCRHRSCSRAARRRHDQHAERNEIAGHRPHPSAAGETGPCTGCPCTGHSSCAWYFQFHSKSVGKTPGE